jgi:Holliday junction DNA helicase RuvB
VIDKFSGGPIGLETLATSVCEEKTTLEDVYEPYLIQSGFLSRTQRGRVATVKAFEHFGRKPPRPDSIQPSLFDSED